MSKLGIIMRRIEKPCAPRTENIYPQIAEADQPFFQAVYACRSCLDSDTEEEMSEQVKSLPAFFAMMAMKTRGAEACTAVADTCIAKRKMHRAMHSALILRIPANASTSTRRAGGTEHHASMRAHATLGRCMIEYH